MAWVAGPLPAISRFRVGLSRLRPPTAASLPRHVCQKKEVSLAIFRSLPSLNPHGVVLNWHARVLLRPSANPKQAVQRTVYRILLAVQYSQDLLALVARGTVAYFCRSIRCQVNSSIAILPCTSQESQFRVASLAILLSEPKSPCRDHLPACSIPYCSRYQMGTHTTAFPPLTDIAARLACLSRYGAEQMHARPSLRQQDVPLELVAGAYCQTVSR